MNNLYSSNSQLPLMIIVRFGQNICYSIATFHTTPFKSFAQSQQMLIWSLTYNWVVDVFASMINRLHPTNIDFIH